MNQSNNEIDNINDISIYLNQILGYTLKYFYTFSEIYDLIIFNFYSMHLEFQKS